tara:strand:+ start:2027 stop:2269 length:243 start_codon:yes stop_codon:yes gene_type:complete
MGRERGRVKLSNKNEDQDKTLQSALFKGIMENTTLKSQLEEVRTKLKSLEDRLTKIDLTDSRKKTPNIEDLDLKVDNDTT